MQYKARECCPGFAGYSDSVGFVVDVVLDFENHDDVGIHFLQYIHKNLSKLITK